MTPKARARATAAAGTIRTGEATMAAKRCSTRSVKSHQRPR
jgi:hypothetical protein